MPTTRTTTDKLLAALAEHPEATAAELAESSGVGRSTAAKILATLESDRRATRTPGGQEDGRRMPDRWSAAGHLATNSGRSPKTSAPADGVGRLGKGDLRAMVLDHLQGHPGEAFTPTKVAKALGRSAGAVSNALVKLTVEGSAVQAGEHPRRFAHRG